MDEENFAIPKKIKNKYMGGITELGQNLKKN